MGASVKYWYLSRISAGVSMNSMLAGFCKVANTLLASEAKVRALPEPRLVPTAVGCSHHLQRV